MSKIIFYITVFKFFVWENLFPTFVLNLMKLKNIKECKNYTCWLMLGS